MISEEKKKKSPMVSGRKGEAHDHDLEEDDQKASSSVSSIIVDAKVLPKVVLNPQHLHLVYTHPLQARMPRLQAAPDVPFLICEHYPTPPDGWIHFKTPSDTRSSTKASNMHR